MSKKAAGAGGRGAPAQQRSGGERSPGGKKYVFGRGPLLVGDGLGFFCRGLLLFRCGGVASVCERWSAAADTRLSGGWGSGREEEVGGKVRGREE